jgi:uncharacterized protein
MTSQRIEIPFDGAAPLDARVYGTAQRDRPVLILAHGAGAGQQSRFMTLFAEALDSRGVGVITFDFPYIQQGRRVPDRPAVLEGAWRAVLRHAADAHLVAPGRFVIGGKSMGGRIASQVLAQPSESGVGAAGLVLLGYPLHPPGRPRELRVAHLPSLAVPALVVQGERDAFGSADEVREAFAVSRGTVEVLAIPGADHSFKVPRGGDPQAVVDEQIRDRVAAWIVATSGSR